jgi:hypothetical protein
MIKHKRNLLIKPHFLKDNTASLCLNNWGGIVIQLTEDCEGVKYQFNFGDNKPSEILESEIIYEINEDFPSEDDDEYQPCFYTSNNERYFINEFMRDDIR